MPPGGVRDAGRPALLSASVFALATPDTTQDKVGKEIKDFEFRIADFEFRKYEKCGSGFKPRCLFVVSYYPQLTCVSSML